jgi:hypothetical protein
VLLSHLVLFGFVYPGERGIIPDAVLGYLLRQLDRERVRPVEPDRVCDGTLLSREQYLFDITERGYADGRATPRGRMTATEIAHWTAAIDADPAPPAPSPAPGLAVLRPNGPPGRRARRRRR